MAVLLQPNNHLYVYVSQYILFYGCKGTAFFSFLQYLKMGVLSIPTYDYPINGNQQDRNRKEMRAKTA